MNKIRYKILKGMSLVEMIVAMGIFIIGTTAFALIFVRSVKNNASIAEERENSFAASQGINLITEELRRARRGDEGSYLVKSADKNDLIVYVDVDHDKVTERVHYFLDINSKKIKKGITEPTGSNPISYPSGDEIIVDIMNNVTNNESNPIFYYYGRNFPISVDPIASPVASDFLQDIRLIKVVVSVDFNPNKNPNNISLESIIELRNINNYVY
jgi:type II secretory pathway pseudopilin PulG